MPQQVQSLNSSFSPRSPRENVNHGGQESQRTHVRQNILLNVQNEDVANTWTEVLRARTSRLDIARRFRISLRKSILLLLLSDPLKVFPFRVPLNKNAPPSTKQDPQDLPKKKRAKKNLLLSKCSPMPFKLKS